MSDINTYMGWTFSDVLTASYKLKVVISCDDAEALILKVSTNHSRHVGCTWQTIYDAVREHVKENQS